MCLEAGLLHSADLLGSGAVGAGSVSMQACFLAF